MEYFPFLSVVVVDAFRQSDLMNHLVIWGLIYISVHSLAIVFDRWPTYKWMMRCGSRVICEYRKYSHPAGANLAGLHKFSGNPVSEVYEAVINEMFSILSQHGVERDSISQWTSDAQSIKLNAGETEKLKSVAERVLSEQTYSVEKGITLLGTFASISPSLGLFGTVWGVMVSFMSMASGGGAALITSVAPGISGALLTTVVGLIVGIPAGIVYNGFCRTGGKIISETENFTDELLADIARFHG